MITVDTVRFGQLKIQDDEKIILPQGILGFPELNEYCFVDAGDDTLILWLQSVQNPGIAFPVLEPKIFKSDYNVQLSTHEQRDLQLEAQQNVAVFCIVTIPDDVSLMTANLKAPLVINLKKQLAKQIVLQENDLPIRFPMFKELRTHLLTIRTAMRAGVVDAPAVHTSTEAPSERSPIRVRDLPVTI